jgi:predicted transcriptional regulator
MDEFQKPSLVDLSVGIVSAYVTNNSVRPGELPTLISEVYRALSSTSQGLNQPAAEPLTGR